MQTKTQPKIRPYWHVDAKWISGILLFFALGAALLFFNLSTLTERGFAIRASATIVAGLFSKDGLDDAKGVEEFKQRAATLPDDAVITPIEQFPGITLSKQDVMQLSPQDLRLKIFSQLTTPIYDKGLEGAAAGLTDNPAAQQQFVKQASLLSVATKTTHETARGLFIATSVAALLLIAIVVFFSAGWGRVVSPGLLLVGSSLPGALAGMILARPPTNGDAPLATLPPVIREGIAESLAYSYTLAAALGLLLLVIAPVGKMVQIIIIRRKKSQTANT